MNLGISVVGLVNGEGRVTQEGELPLHGDELAEAVRLRSGAVGRVVNDAEATLRAAVEYDPQTFDPGNAILLTLG